MKIFKARAKNGLLGFVVVNGQLNGRQVQFPSQEIRSVVAQNIDKIEKHIKTRLTRTTKDGSIHAVLGGGSYGVVFRLNNGNVLKVSKDKTEAGNALFWMNAQRKHPKLLKATAKIYKVFRLKYKGKVYDLIEREAVDAKTYIPPSICNGLMTFTDGLILHCGKNSEVNFSYYQEAKSGLIQMMGTKEGADIAYAMQYAWMKGLPQFDAMPHNFGRRIQPVSEKDGTHAGNIVLFDFGLHTEDCVDKVRSFERSNKFNTAGALKKYQRKVKVI